LVEEFMVSAMTELETLMLSMVADDIKRDGRGTLDP